VFRSLFNYRVHNLHNASGMRHIGIFSKALGVGIMTEYRSQLLTIIEKWLPSLTVVVGAVWGLYTFIDHQKQLDREARRQADSAQESRNFEARKPFLEKQLALYVEVSKLSGYLVTHQPTDADWRASFVRHEAMYWSDLAMVQSPAVEAAMGDLARALVNYSNDPTSNQEEKDRKRTEAAGAASRLSHAMREDLEGIWQQKAKLPQTPG
jgi:hypothetical protein